MNQVQVNILKQVLTRGFSNSVQILSVSRSNRHGLTRCRESQRSFHKSCACERFHENDPRGEYKNKKLRDEIEKVTIKILKVGFKGVFI